MRWRNSPISTATTAHMTTIGGMLMTPNVFVAGEASRISHSGAVPENEPSVCTWIRPSAIVPIASVTISGWI